MSDANSPGDGETAGPAMPQLPEVKPFTIGKAQKKSAMPRAEPLPEPKSSLPRADPMPEPRSALPRAEPFEEPMTISPPQTLTMLSNALTMTATANNASQGRDNVFTSLVRADSDIVGLVAYSIHKQNENDWLQAFTKANSRPPDGIETAAYLLGEATPRRLATYRHLATATLAGNGPEVPAGNQAETYTPPGNFAAPRYMPTPARSEAPAGRGFTTLAYIGLGIIFVVAVLLAARYGLPGISAPHQ